MKNIFVDTNILVDLIGDRKPFSKFAIQIFTLAERGSLRLYVSSHSLATTYYLLKKYVSETDLRKILYQLLDFVEIVPLDESMIKRGLRSDLTDFEDALQVLAAASVKNIDCIVTRNKKDFSRSEIPALAPDELAALI